MLRVALEELAALGAPSAARQVYGADIDGSTACWAAHLVSQGVPAGNLISADFLGLEPGRDLPHVSAVVGNPPYVRHHWIADSTRRLAADVAKSADATLARRASLWAYFIVHACRFVEAGGRMALLLPGSLLQADYAPAVLRHVENAFTDVVLVRVFERIFDDASEATVVLLASGAHAPASSTRRGTRLAAVNDLVGLEQFLAQLSTETTPVSISPRQIPGVPEWKSAVVSQRSLELIELILLDQNVSRLGDVARVALGTVTGANRFFVVSTADAERLGVAHWTSSVVGRSAWLRGPDLTEAALTSASADGCGRILQLPSDLVVDGRTRLGRYIAQGRLDGLPNRWHCRRDPWWSLGSIPTPDAFLPYMVGQPRGLALNSARASSTNTVHQVTWRDAPDSALARSWALSTWSVVGRVCAELFGRQYGGGVLKLELADAQRLPLIGCLEVSEDLWRDCATDTHRAHSIADSALLASGIGLEASDFSVLQQALEHLSHQRTGSRVSTTAVGGEVLERVGNSPGQVTGRKPSPSEGNEATPVDDARKLVSSDG